MCCCGWAGRCSTSSSLSACPPIAVSGEEVFSLDADLVCSVRLGDVTHCSWNSSSSLQILYFLSLLHVPQLVFLGFVCAGSDKSPLQFFHNFERALPGPVKLRTFGQLGSEARLGCLSRMF